MHLHILTPRSESYDGSEPLLGNNHAIGTLNMDPPLYDLFILQLNGCGLLGKAKITVSVRRGCAEGAPKPGSKARHHLSMGPGHVHYISIAKGNKTWHRSGS